MLWAALRPSLYSMDREIIVYRKLVSKFWTVGTYSEKIFGDYYCCFLLNIHWIAIRSKSYLWLSVSKAGVGW